MILGVVGLMHLASILWVDVQGATLSRVVCENAPCAGNAYQMSFKLSGTPGPDASTEVGFYKNGEVNGPACTVPIVGVCNPSNLCDCTLSGGEKTFHYIRSSAASSNDNGNWTAIVQAISAADRIQSPGCQVEVNNSCDYLERSNCTESVQAGKTLYISYTQSRTFPSTAVETLDFVINGQINTSKGSLRWRNCPMTNEHVGCTGRSGALVFYFNDTATFAHSGDWTAVIYANSDADTIRSPICHVEVTDQFIRRTAEGLLATSAVLSVLSCIIVIVIVFFFFKQGHQKLKLAVAFGGALLVLVFVIALGAYNLGTNVALIRRIPSIFIASAVFVALGILVVFCLIGIGIWLIMRKPEPPVQAGTEMSPSLEASNGAKNAPQKSRR